MVPVASFVFTVVLPVVVSVILLPLDLVVSVDVYVDVNVVLPVSLDVVRGIALPYTVVVAVAVVSFSVVFTGTSFVVCLPLDVEVDTRTDDRVPVSVDV